MEKYIPLDALVAEIEKLKNEDYYDIHDEYDGFVRNALDKVLSSIDTFEVKDADLEKEYKDFVEEDPVYNKLVNGIVGKAIAKHFFELGLKAQNNTTNLKQRISVLKMEFWTGLQTFENSEMTLSDAYNQGVDDILEELGLIVQKGE